MRKLIDYIVSMKYIPEILKMLRKDKNGIYYVNMQIYGDAGFTFLDEYEFKLLQTAIRAITKQDELTLDYTYSFEGDDELSELNAGITELIGENQQMRSRVNALRDKLNAKPE